MTLEADDTRDSEDPVRKPIKLDPEATFHCKITITPELQARIQEAADRDCPICLGRGLHDTVDKGWQLCSCLDVGGQLP